MEDPRERIRVDGEEGGMHGGRSRDGEGQNVVNRGVLLLPGVPVVVVARGWLGSLSSRTRSRRSCWAESEKGGWRVLMEAPGKEDILLEQYGACLQEGEAGRVDGEGMNAMAELVVSGHG